MGKRIRAERRVSYSVHLGYNCIHKGHELALLTIFNFGALSAEYHLDH